MNLPQMRARADQLMMEMKYEIAQNAGAMEIVEALYSNGADDVVSKMAMIAYPALLRSMIDDILDIEYPDDQELRDLP